jgi:hypothetical protein
MLKVVIADDEPFVREGLKSLIDWEKIGVKLVGDFENGKDLIGSLPVLLPDIVITDIQMPSISGLQIAKYISENYKNVIVILLTAYSKFQYAKEAIEYGVKHYVVKNDLLDELPLILAKIVSENTESENQSDLNNDDANIENCAYVIQDIEKYIEENLDKKLSLTDIAESIHMNKSYISRMFKEKAGENLFDYINKRKIEKAKHLIKNNELRMYEIALNVGMEDTAYFSRVFKKYEGISPSEYQKELRG